MGSRLRALGVAATLLTTLSFAPRAYADPTPSPAEKETARGLMDEGQARRDHGDLKGALASYAAADAIMHVPTTGLELARAQAALGLLVEARDTLQRVMRIPPRDLEPSAFVAARKNASALDDDLAARIPSIRVVVRGARDGTATATASVTIDDVALPASIVGEPFKVDPGSHLVRGSVGGASAEARVEVAERETRTVTLDLARPVAPAAPVAPAVTTPPTAESATSPQPLDETTPADGHPMRVLMWTGVAVAGVGVVVGSITGLVSLSQTSSARSPCQGDRCPASDQGAIDSARTTATVSTVAFVVAGVGAAAALTGWLVGDRPSRAHDASVTPWVGPGSAGVRGTF